MVTRIHVGNLPYWTTAEELARLFGRYGDVSDAHVSTEPGTSRSRGSGFVYMSNETDAHTAIASLNGTELGGRMLHVEEARSQG